MSKVEAVMNPRSRFFYWALVDDKGIVKLELSAEIVGVLERLPEQTEAYFDVSGEHEMLAVGSLVNIRARPNGILNANNLMMAAYHDDGDRREPISVRLLGDGRWLVLDGNSTTINALFSGWSIVPCRIEK